MAVSPATVALIASLVTAAPRIATVKATHPGTLAQIPFTDGILTFSDISAFSWQSWTQLFPLNARKYPLRVEADGSLEYLASNDAPSPSTPGSVASLQSPGMAKFEPEVPLSPGTPLYHVRIRQNVRSGNTERFVSFTVTNYSGTELLKLEFLTQGTGLGEVPAEQLANGLLPFYPSGQGERIARTTIVLLGTERVTTTVRRESVGGVEYLEALLGQGPQDSLFFMYREWSSATEHRLFYHYTSTQGQGMNSDEWDWAAGTTFEVRKIRKPGERLGSEFFWVDRQPTGMNTFQDRFTKIISTPIAQNWQQGFGNLAGFMFLPGFQP